MSQQSEDPERLIPQQPENLHADAMLGKRKCPLSGHDLAPRHQARDLALPRRLRERREKVLRSRSATVSPSRGPQEQVTCDACRKQLEQSCTYTQNRRMEVRVQDIFADFEDTESALR